MQEVAAYYKYRQWAHVLFGTGPRMGVESQQNGSRIISRTGVESSVDLALTIALLPAGLITTFVVTVDKYFIFYFYIGILYSSQYNHIE